MRKIHFCLLLCVGLLLSCANQKEESKTRSSTSIDYETSWEKIESLEQKGLQRTAIQELNLILESAAKNEAYGELFKALTYRARYLQYLEEESSNEIIGMYHDQIDLVNSPGKEILQSALAEIYQQFRSSQSRSIRERTKRSRFDEKELTTLSDEELKELTIKYYLRSLENDEKNSKIQLQSLKQLYLQEGEDSLFVAQLSVYDFLASRAIEYLGNQTPFKGKIAEEVKLFSPKKVFNQVNWSELTEDIEIAQKFHIYAKLLKEHEEAEAEDLAHHFNMRRLWDAFLFSNHPKKDSLYKSAVKQEIGELQRSINRDDARRQLAEKEWLEHNYQASMEICDQCEDPGSNGTKVCVSLQKRVADKNVRLSAERVYSSDRPLLFSFEYKNLEVAHFRIIRLDPKEVSDLGRQNNKEIKAFIKNGIEREWKQEIKTWTDYKSHRAEIMSPGLSCGDYALVASTNPDFDFEDSPISLITFKVSNIAFLERTLEDQSKLIALKDRISGKPLVNAKVTLLSVNYDPSKRKNQWEEVKELRSDENGQLTIKSNGDYKSLMFRVDHEDQYLIPSNRFYINFRREYPEARKQTLFYTDRSIYRPGQTVYFKGIIFSTLKNSTLKENEKVIPNEKTTVKLYDAKGQEIAQKELMTNELGSFASEFKLPNDQLNGNFRIANKNGSFYFRVEEYKRPSIQILFDSTQKIALKGDSICLRGKIQSYTGLPVKQAKVEYIIYKNPQLYRGGMYSSYWPPVKPEIVSSGTMELDEEKFEICYSPEANEKGAHHYSIEVNVTDALGETVQETKEVYLKELPYQFEFKDAINLSIEELNLSQLIATDVEGKEVKVKGELQLWSLQTPEKVSLKKYWEKSDHQLIKQADYEKNFPYFSYDGGWQLEKLKREALLISSAFSSGEALNAFRNLPQGAYQIQFISATKNGDSVQLSKNFRLIDHQSKKPPYPEYFWWAIEKEQLQQGEKVRVQLNTSLKDFELLLELEHEGEIIDRKKVKLSDEKRWLELSTKDRFGDLKVYISGIREGRSIGEQKAIIVEKRQKDFSLFLKTKRDYTRPGQKESWTLGVRDLKEGQEIEVMASLYDASLDQIQKQEWKPHHRWKKSSLPNWNPRFNFGMKGSREYRVSSRPLWSRNTPSNSIPLMNWYNFYLGASPMMADYDGFSTVISKKEAAFFDMNGKSLKLAAASPTKAKDQVRIDFRETVFFYPQLNNNENNEVELQFEMPDALTEWRFKALAHDREMNFHQIEHSIISRKELMVKSFLPRFFRTNDKGKLYLEVTNASDNIINGQLSMKFFDAESGRELDLLENEKDEFFDLLPGQNFRISYRINCPSNPRLLKYRLEAISEQHQDIEEGFLPIIPSSTLITESYPFELKAGESKELQYEEFAKRSSSVKENRKYKVEYASDPRWLAVYALPSMLNANEENPEMVFSSLYAFALGQHTFQGLSQEIDFKTILAQYDPNSQLGSNNDINYLAVESTPWMSASKEEKLQRSKLNQLMDENQASYTIGQKLALLKKLQNPDGGFSWFKGMRSNPYISQYILAGLGKLDALGILENAQHKSIAEQIQKNTNQYLDTEVEAYLKRLKDRGVDQEADHLNPRIIHYLLARSYEKNWIPSDAAAFFLAQTEQYWQARNPLLKAQIGITHFQLNSNSELSYNIISSLKDAAIRDSLGIHWKSNRSPYWHQSPIETQAYCIELYSKVLGDDPEVAEMKKWLLHQKKQQYWSGNTATASATYSLLHDEKDFSIQTQEGNFMVGREMISAKGNLPGYSSKSWTGDEIQAELSEIKIRQEESTFGWGSAYWQYYEEMDKIGNRSMEGLKIKSEYYHYSIDGKGNELLEEIREQDLKVGDLIKQRTEIIVDYDLDYVFISDQAPACLESVKGRSGIEFKDGLSIYINVKDTERQWFIDHLSKGSYVFETDYRISHSGEFQGGVSQLQCFYAPEFTVYSKAKSLSIK